MTQKHIILTKCDEHIEANHKKEHANGSIYMKIGDLFLHVQKSSTPFSIWHSKAPNLPLKHITMNQNYTLNSRGGILYPPIEPFHHRSLITLR